MSLKRRLVSAAFAAGIIVSMAPLGTPALADDCDNPVIMFSRTGVFIPENPSGRTSVGNTTLESSYYGCAFSEEGVTFDSWYIYPGATMTKGRGGSSAQFACARLGGLGADWCNTLAVVEGTLPGSFNAETPWLGIDPTKSGETYLDVPGLGQSHKYRTIDR